MSSKQGQGGWCVAERAAWGLSPRGERECVRGSEGWSGGLAKLCLVGFRSFGALGLSGYSG